MTDIQAIISLRYCCPTHVVHKYDVVGLTNKNEIGEIYALL